MITKLQFRDPVMLGKWERSSGDTGISLGGENRTDFMGEPGWVGMGTGESGCRGMG